MTELIARTLRRLGGQLPGSLSLPGDDRYAAVTALWAKPAGPMPRAVAHCCTREDVQLAIRAARDCDLPLSIRGGGHDWAGRALCAGLVIDLSDMNGVVIDIDHRIARVSGGARAADVAAKSDPLGFAAVSGSCGAVGMAGLTLGGGYGALIGRTGLALDNLRIAEIILADGSFIVASHDEEPELFWALRGGGGNFGVVTAMHHQLHELPSVRSGMLLFPFAEARAVLDTCVEFTASAPEELTIQLGLVVGPNGAPVVMVVPTWSGPPEEGEARVEPLFRLGTVLSSTVTTMPYGAHLSIFDSFIVGGQRVCMETCWLPALDTGSVDTFIHAMANVVSPGCAIVTHEFRGAASRVPEEATAFGLRRDHVLVEVIAICAAGSDQEKERRHRGWAAAVRRNLAPMSLPGGYPNLLGPGESERAALSYGRNAQRLIDAKRRYDPDNIFRAAIPLPVGEKPLALAS